MAQKLLLIGDGTDADHGIQADVATGTRTLTFDISEGFWSATDGMLLPRIGMGKTPDTANSRLELKSTGAGNILIEADEAGSTQRVFQILEESDSAGVLRLYNGADAIAVNLDGNGHNYISTNPGAAGVPAVWLHNSGNLTDYDGVVISSVNNGADAEVLHVRTNNTTYNDGTSLMLVRGNGQVVVGAASPYLSDNSLYLQSADPTLGTSLTLFLLPTGTPQILDGDYLGVLYFGGKDNNCNTSTDAETLSNAIGAFIRAEADGDWDGADTNPTALTFHTHPDSDLGTAMAPEHLRIDSVGRIGVGKTPDTANSRLELKSSGAGNIIIEADEAGSTQRVFQLLEESDSAGVLRLFDGADAITVNLDGNGLSYFNGGNTVFGSNAATSHKVAVTLSDANTAIGNGTFNLELSNADQTNNNYVRISFNDGIGQAGAATIGAQITDHTNKYGNLQLLTRGASGAAVRVLISEDGNVGIGIPFFGASAAGVLAIANGTQGAALADAIQITSEDLSAGNTIPSIRTEGGGIFSAGTPAAASGSIAIKVDGTVRYITVSNSPAS